MRVVASFLVCIATYVTATSASQQQSLLGAPVLPDVLATLLEAYKPLLTNYARSELPATIGNCGEENAPAPCTEAGNLYDDKNTFYHVKARWVSGINTMRIDGITMTFDDAGTITLGMNANFAQLPTSLLVRGCGGVLGCVTVLDNTKSCCGSDKNVAIAATAKCSESYPFVTNFAISEAKITPAINVEIDIFGKTFKVADVTPSIENGLKNAAGNFLATKGLDLFNNQIKELFGDKIYCSQASKNAQTPAPTTTTVAPTPSPTNATTTSVPTTTAENSITSPPSASNSGSTTSPTTTPKSISGVISSSSIVLATAYILTTL